MKNKDQVFLLLGGNLGDVANTFRKARNEISQLGRIVKQSSLYLTEAWGMENANDFMNQALLITTDLSPKGLLQKLHNVEEKMGRDNKPSQAGEKYESRTLDIDILFWGDEIIQATGLDIPHPRLHLRNFTLQPLNEIAPDFEHPVLHDTIGTLLKKSQDTLKVTRV